MDKEQYFAKSRKKELPPRCPLLGHCDRWAQTIFFYQFFDSETYSHRKIDYLQKLTESGIISADFNEKSIKIIAEHPEFLRDEERVSYRNMCPEVNLFDENNALFFAKGTASISGEYDSYRMKYGQKGLNNYSERHYEECLEFSSFIYDNLDKNKLSKFFVEKRKRRIPISTKLRFEIFTRDNFKCQYCARTISDGIKLEIDHKTPIAEGGTDNYDNLITSCNECNNGKSNKIV